MGRLTRLRYIFNNYILAILLMALIVALDILSFIRIPLDAFILTLISQTIQNPSVVDSTFVVVLSIIVFLLPGLFFRFLNLHQSALGTVLAFASLCTGVGVALMRYNTFIPPLYPVISLIIGTFFGTSLQLVILSREKEFLKNAFSRYVSPIILNDIMHHPENLSLQVSERDVTVLFLDIRGFTTYTEDHNAKLVVKRLNELLDMVTEIITQNKGTVDKYIGDSVLAFWGAPNADHHQAKHAVSAALAIREAIETTTEFSVGIGINYGPAIVGNVGSSRRFAYTIIGDTVNTAARLERATRELDRTLLVSSAVLEKCREEEYICDSELLGTFKLKGRSKPLKVFALPMFKKLKAVSLRGLNASLPTAST